MKNVIFIIYPSVSHYTSVYPIADRLSGDGGNIFFTGNEYIRSKIDFTPFNFIQLNYLEDYRILGFKDAISIFVNSVFSKRFLTERYRDYLLSMREVDKLLEAYCPDELWVDSHICHYALLAYQRKINVRLVNTKLSTSKAKGIPPLYSSIVFHNTPQHKILANMLWRYHYLRTSLEDILISCFFCGRPLSYFIERTKSRYLGKSFVFFKPKKFCSFYDEIDYRNTGIETYVIGADQLEYPWGRDREGEIHLNYKPMSAFAKPGKSDNFMIPVSQFFNEVRGTKIIYCSFGTLVRNHEKRVYNFFIKLIKIFESRNDLTLILATNGLINKKEFNSPKNVLLFDHVPQFNLLDFCDLMITHGGLNSVRECICKKVPMLVIPVDSQYDQRGNSARVAYFKYGMRGKLSDSDTQLLRKILLLTQITTTAKTGNSSTNNTDTQ